MSSSVAPGPEAAAPVLDQPQSTAPQAQKGKGLAIAALVIAIFSLLFSWVPIFNNVMAVTAFVSLVLGLVAFLGARKGKRAGKAMALASVLVSVLAIVIVFASQALYVKALDDVSDALDPKVTATGAAGAPAAAGTKSPAAADAAFTVGQAAKISANEDEAATITVNSVKVSEKALGQYGEKAQNGSFKLVNVTVVNSGTEAFDVNPFDWYLRDAAGNKYAYGDGNAISSGFEGPSFNATTLAAKEKRSGTMVIDAPKAAVELVYAPGWDAETVALWKIR